MLKLVEIVEKFLIFHDDQLMFLQFPSVRIPKNAGRPAETEKAALLWEFVSCFLSIWSPNTSKHQFGNMSNTMSQMLHQWRDPQYTMMYYRKTYNIQYDDAILWYHDNDTLFFGFLNISRFLGDVFSPLRFDSWTLRSWQSTSRLALLEVEQRAANSGWAANRPVLNTVLWRSSTWKKSLQHRVWIVRIDMLGSTWICLDPLKSWIQVVLSRFARLPRSPFSASLWPRRSGVSKRTSGLTAVCLSVYISDFLRPWCDMSAVSCQSWHTLNVSWFFMFYFRVYWWPVLSKLVSRRLPFSRRKGCHFVLQQDAVTHFLAYPIQVSTLFGSS